MRLLIIRHAQPDYVNDDLTQHGHVEARALAKRLAVHGIDRVYSSPLGRALRTAGYTAEALGMEVNVEHWTSEIFNQVDVPEWGGKMHVVDVPGEVIRGGTELPAHGSWHLAPPYVPNEMIALTEAVRAGSDAFLARHGYVREGGRYRIAQGNAITIAVFCHAGLGMTWLSHLLGIPTSLVWAGFWPAPSSVTTILFEERSKQWAVPKCLAFGDTSHLFSEGLGVSHTGLYANTR